MKLQIASLWLSNLYFGLGFVDWVGGEPFLVIGFAEYSSAITAFY